MSGSDGANAPIPGWLSQLFNSQGSNCGTSNIPMTMNQQQMQMMMAGSRGGGTNIQSSGPANNGMLMNNASFPQQNNPTQFMQPSNGSSFPLTQNPPLMPPMNGPQMTRPQMNQTQMNGPPHMSLTNMPPSNAQSMMGPTMAINPQFGQSMNVNPQFGQSMNVIPQYGQSMNVNPQFGQPMNGPPRNVVSQFGQTINNIPTNVPQFGQPVNNPLNNVPQFGPPINGPPTNVSQFVQPMNGPPINVSQFGPMNASQPNVVSQFGQPMNGPPPNVVSQIGQPMNGPPQNVVSQFGQPMNGPPLNVSQFGQPINGPPSNVVSQFGQLMNGPPLNVVSQFEQPMNGPPPNVVSQFGQSMSGPPTNMVSQFGQQMNVPQSAQMNRPPFEQTSASQSGQSKDKSKSSSGDATKSPKETSKSQSKDETYKVFVGNISAKVPGDMIQRALAACGDIVRWQRFTTFGFCEYTKPDCAQRCVRLLHGRLFADKKLTAKADKNLTTSPNQSIAMVRHLDDQAEKKIKTLEKEYCEKIENYEKLEKEKALSRITKVLEDAKLAKDVLDLVQREIGKFREDFKEEEVVFTRKKEETRSLDRNETTRSNKPEKVEEKRGHQREQENKALQIDPWPSKRVSSSQSQQPQTRSSDHPKRNLRNLAHTYITQILNLPNVVDDISFIQHKFLNPLLFSVETLKQAGLPVDDWSFVLYHVVSSKLSSDLYRRFQDDYIGNSANYLPPFEDLLTFLKNEIKNTGKSRRPGIVATGKNETGGKYDDDKDDVMVIADSPPESDSHSFIDDFAINEEIPKEPEQVPFVAESNVTESNVAESNVAESNVAESNNEQKEKCVFCHKPHSVKNCPHFKKLPFSDRLKFAKKRKLCYSCLGPHIKTKCDGNLEPCALCGGEHLPVFCKLAN